MKPQERREKIRLAGDLPVTSRMVQRPTTIEELRAALVEYNESWLVDGYRTPAKVRSAHSRID
jgi:hypothetical protein